MELSERGFLAKKFGRSWMYLLMMLVLATLDVGLTQRQRWNINNASDVIEDLLETYDIRLRPRFGGRPWTSVVTSVASSYRFLAYVMMSRALIERNCRIIYKALSELV